MTITHITDEAILAAVDYENFHESPTFLIAHRVGANGQTSSVYRRLLKLEKQGRVVRAPRCPVNSIVWRLA
jgi:hypothetical protein